MTELKILEKDNQEGKLQKILEQACKPRSYASLKPQPTHPITHQGGKMRELKMLGGKTLFYQDQRENLFLGLLIH